MARAIAKLTEGLESFTSIDALQERYRQELAGLGFERYTYVHSLSHILEQASPEYFGESLVLGSTFPEEFREIYRRHGFHRSDPIIEACRNSMAPVDWELTAQREDLNEQGKALFRYARKFGIRHGFSIPIHGPNGGLGIVSLASDMPREDFRRLVDIHQGDIHLMTAMFHERVHQLVPVRRAQEAACHLSPREAECIRWTAQGKTAWEIAQICDISQNTVNFHLKNSMAKLGVHSKTHAVAKALSMGLTTL